MYFRLDYFPQSFSPSWKECRVRHQQYPAAHLLSGLTSHLMHADVALIAEDHLIVVFAIRRLAHVAHHVFIILDAQALLSLHGMRHVVVTALLKLLHHPLHGHLVQRGEGCRSEGL